MDFSSLNKSRRSIRDFKKDCESLLKEIYEKLTKEVGITPYDPGDDIAVID